MNLLMLVLLFLIVILINKSNLQEPFWEPSCEGSACSDCYHLSMRDCMKYANCGLCITNSRGIKDAPRIECVPGDPNGPFFKEDCDQWKKTDSYDKYIFDGKEVMISPPTTAFYPEFEQRWVSAPVRGMM
jgi:hypothetical protein